MPRPNGAAIPAAPRMTLLEWIETDDGITTGPSQPPCSRQAQAIHAQIMVARHAHPDEATESLQPPSDLRLPPLG